MFYGESKLAVSEIIAAWFSKMISSKLWQEFIIRH
jgi:hypothetical protein